ncbi:MAG: hypothetical protein ACPG6V_03795 [Flavobacteriales bacterium]
MTNSTPQESLNLDKRLSEIESKLDTIMDFLQQFKVHGPWKEEELEYIKAHYSSKKTCDIANDLKRSISSVYEVVRKMNLNKKRKILSPEERLYIIENFKSMKYSDIAKEIGITTSALKTQIHKMRSQGEMSYKFDKNR